MSFGSKRKILIAAGISAAIALGLVGVAVVFLPTNPTNPGNCNNPLAQVNQSCPYIDAIDVTTAGTVNFDVVNQGSTAIILSSATITGARGNPGYASSIT